MLKRNFHVPPQSAPELENVLAATTTTLFANFASLFLSLPQKGSSRSMLVVFEGQFVWAGSGLLQFGVHA